MEHAPFGRGLPTLAEAASHESFIDTSSMFREMPPFPKPPLLCCHTSNWHDRRACTIMTLLCSFMGDMVRDAFEPSLSLVFARDHGWAAFLNARVV